MRRALAALALLALGGSVAAGLLYQAASRALFASSRG